MEITIQNYRQITSERKSYTVYIINIKFLDWQHTVEKRYSEFLQLHQVIKLINKNFMSTLPKFPKKKYWTKIIGETQDMLENRRSMLEIYMRELSRNVCSKHCKFFYEFLAMPLRLRDTWMSDFT